MCRYRAKNSFASHWSDAAGTHSPLARNGLRSWSEQCSFHAHSRGWLPGGSQSSHAFGRLGSSVSAEKLCRSSSRRRCSLSSPSSQWSGIGCVKRCGGPPCSVPSPSLKMSGGRNHHRQSSLVREQERERERERDRERGERADRGGGAYVQLAKSRQLRSESGGCDDTPW